MKLIITERQLTYLSLLNEDDSSVYTVDNFDLVYKLINLNNDDEFYYIEIIKRKKDNPTDSFRYAQYLKYYIITSKEQLQSLKPEIIKMCNDNNARAYILLNPRSAKAVNDYTQVLKQKFAQRGKGFGKYRGHEFEVAAGQHKENWNSRPISFIDIDSTNTAIFDKVKEILKMYGITPIAEYKTPNGGLHIIVPDKKAKYIDFSSFDNGKHLGKYATVHFNMDAPTLLYSNIIPQGY